MKLNIKHIKNTLDCDDSFIVTLFKSYLKESDECVNNIEKGLQDQDWSLIKGAAHKMLSSTRIFDLKELTNALESIEENAIEEEKRQLIPSLFNTLKTNQNLYIHEIKKVINELNHEIEVT